MFGFFITALNWQKGPTAQRPLRCCCRTGTTQASAHTHTYTEGTSQHQLPLTKAGPVRQSPALQQQGSASRPYTTSWWLTESPHQPTPYKEFSCRAASARYSPAHCHSLASCSGTSQPGLPAGSCLQLMKHLQLQAGPVRHSPPLHNCCPTPCLPPPPLPPAELSTSDIRPGRYGTFHLWADQLKMAGAIIAVPVRHKPEPTHPPCQPSTAAAELC